MSSTPQNDSDDLGELFVDVTGESTLTESQEHQSNRYDDSRLSEEVTDMAQQDGLDEAVEQPDSADIS